MEKEHAGASVGDPKKCGNYRSVKLLEHGMKVVERVFESRLRKVLEVIWWALRRKGVSEKLVRGVQEMYKDVATAVRLDGQHSEYFPVEVGVHQGSVLSPLLFAAIMDEATRDLEKGSKSFLYADDIVLLGESWEEVGNRYREWKEALEGKGLKVNVQKTKAMKLGGKKEMKAAEVDPCAVCRRRVMRNSIRCTVCGGWVHKRCSRVRGSLVRVVGFVCKRCCDDLVEVDQEEKVKLGSDEVEIVKEFCYLGDMLETEGGVEAAVAARVRVGWRKFKEISGMLCGRDVSMKIKGQLYKACVRSAMCYGAECWALRKEEVTRLRMAEMRMVRMMCGKTLPLPKALFRVSTIKFGSAYYQFRRLPMGLFLSPYILQTALQALLAGVPQIWVHIDDLLLWGRNAAELQQRIRRVVRLLHAARFRINTEKSQLIPVAAADGCHTLRKGHHR